LDLVFKIAPISDHVAKFRGDRPRDRGDLVANKKKKKLEIAAQGIAQCKVSAALRRFG